MSNQEILSRLQKQHHEGQAKYIYFLLAASGACIAYSLEKAQGTPLIWNLIFLGGALLFWALSFLFGCLLIQKIQALIGGQDPIDITLKLAPSLLCEDHIIHREISGWKYEK